MTTEYKQLIESDLFTLKNITNAQHESIRKFMDYKAGPELDKEDEETFNLLCKITDCVSADPMSTKEKIAFMLRMGVGLTDKRVSEITKYDVGEYVAGSFIKSINAEGAYGLMLKNPENYDPKDVKKQLGWLHRIVIRHSFWEQVEKLMEK